MKTFTLIASASLLGFALVPPILFTACYFGLAKPNGT